MKLRYDEEINILKDIHELDSKECLILSDSNHEAETAYVLETLFENDFLDNWSDNTKSKNPPDFINENESFIMEVMRVDDHSNNGKNNPEKARERKLRKEIDDFLGKIPNVDNIFINAVTDLPTEIDHNYRNYYTSFQRTVKKHLEKLNKYKMNYPNKSTVFLVADETSGMYFESVVFDGKAAIGRPHFPFLDKRFVTSFLDSPLDYLIWFIPYNHSKYIKLPRLIIFDVQNCLKNEEVVFFDYDESRMNSSEE